MSVGQIIVIISLLCQMYGVPAEQMICLVERESNYDVQATNAVHLGLAQFRYTEDETSTWHWMSSLAHSDPRFLHKDLLQRGPYDPVAALSLMAWAIANGYESPWSTLPYCRGGLR
jgi:hypothetical protein